MPTTDRACQYLELFRTLPNMPSLNTVASIFCPHQSQNVRNAILTTVDLYDAGLHDDDILAVTLLFWPSYYDDINPYKIDLARKISDAVTELATLRRATLETQKNAIIDEAILAIPYMSEKYLLFKYEPDTKSPSWLKHYAEYLKPLTDEITKKYSESNPKFAPALKLMAGKINEIANYDIW